MLTAGKYTARVSAFRTGMHEKKDTGETFPRIDLDFEVEAPASAAGEVISHTIYCSPRSKPEMIKKTLTTCGWDGVDPEELAGLGSRVVELVVEEREYNGKLYPNVKWINTPRGGDGMAHHQMGEEQRSDYGATMRSLLGLGPKRPTAPEPPSGTGQGKDGLPF